MTVEPLSDLEPRDYAREFREVADELNPDGVGMDAAIAHRIVIHLLDNDPDLLAGWLMHNAEGIVREWVAGRARSQRAYIRHAASKRAFNAASLELVKGDAAPLTGLLDALYVGVQGRIRLRDMGRADLLATIAEYRAQASSNSYEASFLEAVARKVRGTQVVGDVWSESALAALRRD